MIRSLYIRTVGTFIIVVLISVIVSFLLSGHLFRRDAEHRFQNDMLTKGYMVIQLLKETNMKKPDSYIERLAGLQNDLFTIYNRSGAVHQYGTIRSGATFDTGIRQDEIDRVLNGETYRRPETASPPPPEQIVVGIPFEWNGEPRALFLQPNFPGDQLRMEQATLLVLLLALGLGSVMILIASRYLVRPLKRLAEATRELARGNFDVQVKLQRKDEIGLLADSFNHLAGELRQLETMRQDFVANVSHEIQSPLTSIRGFSKAIREKIIDECDRDRCLAIIESESDRLSRLVDNMLRLASLESDRHPFHPVWFDLDEQLRQVLMRSEPLLADKKIVLEATLPRTKVKGDEDQLYQVWLNLLQNSIKFTPPGGRIVIGIEQERHGVAVIIRDFGIGIASDDLAHIFERFYKADKSRDASAEGSGLGLSIVKKIVDNHQGDIRLVSEEGSGVLATVLLPSGS